MPVVTLGGDEPLTWAGYEAVVHGGARVRLAGEGRIDAHRAALQRRLDEGAIIYSVTTGCGFEAGQAIPADALAAVQANTVASHAVGVGPPVDELVARGMLVLIAQSAAQGPPAFRREIVAALVRAINERRHPPVPRLGSNSASDLVPGAHLALGVLAGEPQLALQAKEGALINNAAFTTALAVAAVRSAQAAVVRAEAVAALTLQALRGFPDAFDARLVTLRPHPGALDVAAHMRSLLHDSALLRAPGRPHDPYSLRCLPQVHGAVRDAIANARGALEIELRAVQDNPVVLADGTVLSGGLFHGAPIGLPLDGVALALGQVAAMSAQRARHLVGGAFGLPPKLTRDPLRRMGLTMLPGVAGALVSECRQRGAPASRESVAMDTMEDHVSMAALAARQAREACELARRVVAIELACAAQALDFLQPALASAPARALHAQVRERLAFVDADRPVDTTVLLDLV